MVQERITRSSFLDYRTTGTRCKHLSKFHIQSAIQTADALDYVPSTTPKLPSIALPLMRVAPVISIEPAGSALVTIDIELKQLPRTLTGCAFINSPEPERQTIS